MQIRHELLGGEAADLAHSPAHQTPKADEAVIGADDVEPAGIQHLIGDAHIREAGVIHQDQAGFILDRIQAFHSIFQLAAAHAKIADGADDGLPDKAGLGRTAMGRSRQRHDLFIVHFFDGCLQENTSSHKYYVSRDYYTVGPKFCQQFVHICRFCPSLNNVSTPSAE